MEKKHLIYVSCFCTSILLSACSSNGPKPEDSLLKLAEFNIEQAQQAGAHEYAPLVLRDAEQHLDKAREAMADEDYMTATQFLEKSTLDAKYAMVKTESDKASLAAEQLKSDLETLQQSISN